MAELPEITEVDTNCRVCFIQIKALTRYPDDVTGILVPFCTTAHAQQFMESHVAKDSEETSSQNGSGSPSEQGGEPDI